MSIQVGWIWTLVSIVYVSHVTLFVLVFLSQWCSHLGHLVIVSVYWWWHETCWVSWVDLSVQIAWVWTLVLIIHVSNIILSILVLLSEWFSHLRYFVIVSINWRRNKTSWMSWVDLRISHVWSRPLVWIVNISNVVLISLVLWDKRLL